MCVCVCVCVVGEGVTWMPGTGYELDLDLASVSPVCQLLVSALNWVYKWLSGGMLRVWELGKLHSQEPSLLLLYCCCSWLGSRMPNSWHSLYEHSVDKPRKLTESRKLMGPTVGRQVVTANQSAFSKKLHPWKPDLGLVTVTPRWTQHILQDTKPDGRPITDCRECVP